jgi:hypothetical protein
VNRKARDRKIAQEIADELAAALGGQVAPVAENSDTVCEVFGRVFDRHGIVSGHAGALVLGLVPKVLAKAAMQREKSSSSPCCTDGAE